MQQRGADEGFELLDARRDDRARDAHLPRSLGKALGFGDAHEGVDGEEAVRAGSAV